VSDIAYKAAAMDTVRQVLALNSYTKGIYVGGFATALSCLMSGILILQHLTHYTNPRVQRNIIFIILMVPLFAVDSYIGLIEAEGSETLCLVLDSIKECYEAFVIASFMELMYALLDVHEDKEVPDSLKGRHVHLFFPFTLVYRHGMHLDQKSLRTMKGWCTQFVVLRPLISVLALVLQVYGKLDAFYTYISIVLNISVTVAVTALMIFYHTFDKELAPNRPLAKFLCIKGVVFFAFWQGIALEVLVYLKVLHEGHWWTTEEVSNAIQNFLVCVEMGLLFSFAHLYAFDAKPYHGGKKAAAAAPASQKKKA